MPGSEILFFNSYSTIEESEMTIDLNVADATKLSEINDSGLLLSIVGEQPIMQTYIKNNKRRTDKMLEALISDGTRTLPITFWADLIDVVPQNTIIQLCNLSSRVFNEDIVLTTNFSSSICFLTETLAVEFEEQPCSSQQVKTDETVCCQFFESLKLESFLTCRFCKKRL